MRVWKWGFPALVGDRGSFDVDRILIAAVGARHGMDAGGAA